jgi:UDP:flavonoid glycosyltransferase YjiC (YdhE family)
VRTLARYVSEERELLRRLRPALVVGDLRLSLPVSAAVEGVPHACLINAYWSSHVVREGFPLPDHPIVRWLGVELAARYFPKALPWVFNHFARPVNVLRRRHGLSPLGSLPDILTHGDHTLFPDVPSLVPTRALPPHQKYLGPVLWSPAVPLPAWWGDLDPARPTIYVTLGSSGHVSRLPLVIEVAAELGYQVLVATAGRAKLGALPAHVYAADYLPGELAARRSLAVVSNGGSTTGYQALAEGRPVLGIAFNLDQYLAMTAIADAGAGVLLRAGNLDRAQLRDALTRLVTEPAFTAAAQRLRGDFAAWNAASNFAAFVDAAAS